MERSTALGRRRNRSHSPYNPPHRATRSDRDTSPVAHTSSKSSKGKGRTVPQRGSNHIAKSSRRPGEIRINRNYCCVLTFGILLGYIFFIVLFLELQVAPPLVERFPNFPRPMSQQQIRGGGRPDNDPSTGLSAPVDSASMSSQLSDQTSDALKRLVQDRNLLSSQSLPTSTTPEILKTPKLPDHRRKKILVTGGAGFVGSHLVDRLMIEGHEVIVVDNFFTGQKKNVAHWLHHPNFSLLVHDVTEPISLEVDQIYHLACPASPPHYQYNPVKTIKTSTMGTLNMLGLAKRVKARMLLASTSEIYGDPQVHPQPESYWGNVNTIGPRACYDEGKRVAETMMYSYKTQNSVPVRVARIFNTFGPRMHPNDGRVVSNFIIQALQNKDITIYGTGDQTRSFQYVSDLVEGLYKLMNSDYDLPVNLGNPSEFKVREFASHIKDMTKSSSKIMFLPRSEDDPTQRKPDISTAKREIEWEPVVSVETGLTKTIDYFQQVLDAAGEIVPTGPGAAKPQT